ncbi:hypothetical protein [Fodinibius sp. Rm-B-1B1-1]|uniref:hypothetical protein n=1 Tax=Fodinibius alkaliphilus TaxID=3140241 RepID=UPI003159B18D
MPKDAYHKSDIKINSVEGKLNLVGPCSYPEKWCNKWNKELSDFYKRFALNPGLLGITPELQNPDDKEKVAEMLNRELSYILNPTLMKDLKRLFGQYQ